jgi:hypothetical protein
MIRWVHEIDGLMHMRYLDVDTWKVKKEEKKSKAIYPHNRPWRPIGL